MVSITGKHGRVGVSRLPRQIVLFTHLPCHTTATTCRLLTRIAGSRVLWGNRGWKFIICATYIRSSFISLLLSTSMLSYYFESIFLSFWGNGTFLPFFLTIKWLWSWHIGYISNVFLTIQKSEFYIEIFGKEYRMFSWSCGQKRLSFCLGLQITSTSTSTGSDENFGDIFITHFFASSFSPYLNHYRH